MKTKFLTVAVLTLLLVVACQTDSEDTFVSESENKEIAVKAPRYVDIGNTVRPIPRSDNGEGLSKSSEKYQVELYMAEYITSGESEEMGNVIFFNNRGNKQLGADFSPFLSLDGSADISYYVDKNRETVDLGAGVSTEAINRAMGTWDDVNCSEFGLNKVSYDGRASGIVAFILGDPDGSDEYVADINHAGWMPAEFFDAIAPPNGSEFILGVTFTFIWVYSNGDPVDTDKNGKADVYTREIYYNDAFPWADGDHYDVETIALHEAGHGLSQGHFGKLFKTEKNGKYHFAPRAVMNAGYTGIQTSINKTDKAGHCSNWAQWPNN